MKQRKITSRKPSYSNMNHFPLDKKLITFGAVVVVFVGIGGYMLGVRSQQNTPPEVRELNPQLADNKNISVTLAQKISTKEYTNTTYKMRFQYPDNWRYKEEPGKITPTIFPIMFNPDDGKQYTSGNVNVWIEKFDGTVDDYIQNTLCHGASCVDPKDASQYVTDTINGKKVISPGPVPAENVVFIKNGYVYRFFIADPYYNEDMKSQIEANRKILYEMLSTFEFLS